MINHVSLGQVVVDAKSNTITAIPRLLKLIEVSGALVTIDAMDCQTETTSVHGKDEDVSSANNQNGS